MVAHTHPQSDGIHSSPANIRHHQTRDHSRNNPGLPVKHKAETDRRNMMSDAVNTSIPLFLENMMKTYLPPVDPKGFDDAFPADKIVRIHAKFQDAVNGKTPANNNSDTPGKEKTISKAWLTVDGEETLCPGYLLNLSPDRADPTDTRKLKVDAALISELYKDAIQKDRPNFDLDDLAIEFKRGETMNDAWDDRNSKNIESKAATRFDVRGQLMSYGERHFYFQHRTGLFMLFVNGGEFRVIRWDRSGCLVTEALNYVESPEHTKQLLQFLYAYSRASSEQRGIDITATRLSKDSCGWQWMRKVATAHPKDLSHVEGTVLESVPEGFVIKASRDAPDSPLFASNILAEDPTATSGFADLPSDTDTAAMVTPVFQYVRDLFRESIPDKWTCYRLKVCGRDYLVGKPIFAPLGMMGRGTRGYVALEWKTQRFVFLKDAWRPFYKGVDSEGATLKILNDNHVPFVPTLVCHEDVDGGRQETEASEYSATGSKKPDVFDEQEKKSRPIAPMPSRPRASRARSATAGGSTPTASTSDGQSPVDATGSRRSAHGSGTGGGSGKRTRTQTTAPVEVDDGTGLRHLTHYRIVVAQVCLPSSAFMTGMQLVRIVWNCIDGHGDAAKRCNILHRDISVGNILIYPTVKEANRTTGQRILVLWGGMLSDWELAKKIPHVDEKPKARQPYRTGTWSYMSVRSVEYPGIPLSIPDELESFFHVLLYLAIRYLRSSLPCPGLFIDDYFMASGNDDHGQTLCSTLKQDAVNNGKLVYGGKPVTFLPDLQRSPESRDAGPSPTPKEPPSASPLDRLIAALLRHFKAHYAVMKYDAAIKQPKPLQSLYDAIAKTSTPAPPIASELFKFDVELMLELRQDYGDGETPVMPAPNDVEMPPDEPTEPREPSAEEKELAAVLTTHERVKALFFTHLKTPAVWPSQDRVGDQLQGYTRTSKRPRHESTTLLPIKEGVEVSPQPSSGV